MQHSFFITDAFYHRISKRNKKDDLRFCIFNSSRKHDALFGPDCDCHEQKRFFLPDWIKIWIFWFIEQKSEGAFSLSVKEHFWKAEEEVYVIVVVVVFSFGFTELPKNGNGRYKDLLHFFGCFGFVFAENYWTKNQENLWKWDIATFT